MVRRLLLTVSALMLALAPVAHAKRSKVPALEAATVRAEPKDDAASVVEVKKGDNLMVLGKQGDWSQVLTDGGKKGWVPSKVVTVASGLESLDPNATEVAAFEGDTAMAMRGRPNPPRTVIVAMGGLDVEVAKRIGDHVRGKQELKVVDVRAEAAAKPGSPAGGVEGASQLGGAKKADVVVAVQAAAGEALAYEVVDLKHKTVLASGTTSPSTDPRIPAQEVADAVAHATAELVKNPAAADPKASPTPEAAKPAPTSEPKKAHPNAPLKSKILKRK